MKKYTLILFLILFSNAFSQTVPKPERERTYDVQHISMNISFDWDQKMVIGDVTTTIVPLADGMTSFEVDAAAFDIESIMVMDIPLDYNYDGKKIKINLPQPINTTDTFGYTVRYTCNPSVVCISFTRPNSIRPCLMKSGRRAKVRIITTGSQYTIIRMTRPLRRCTLPYPTAS